MGTVIRRYELTDAEWERLQPYFLDRQAGDKGSPRKDSRQIRSGMRGSRAASSTIIHAIVDAPGNPLLIQLTAGNEYDVIVVKIHTVKITD